MITGSIRRRTSANAVRTRGEASLSVRLVGRLGRDDRFNRLLRVGGAPERQQTEGAILLDGSRLARRAVPTPRNRFRTTSASSHEADA